MGLHIFDGILDSIIRDVDSCNPEIRHQHLEIMQHAGLKDIYEGDIITIPDTFKEVILEDGSGPSYEGSHLARVEFQQGAFGVTIGGGQIFWERRFYTLKEILEETSLEDLKIITNIHESPELLEEG